MKKIYKTVTEYILSRTIFKFLLIMVMLLVTVPYIREKIDFCINIMIAYGFVILGCELITGKLWRTLRTTKTSMFLCGFGVSYVITILINKTHIIGGFKSLGFMTILFLLCFLFPEDVTKEKIIKEIKLISAEITVITFIFSLISLITYVFSVSGTYFTNEGAHQAFYGMADARLWGIYNPNNSAALTVISLSLSIAFILSNKKKRIRIPLYVNMFIQFSVLLLTGSRAGLYVMAGAVAFFVFFAVAYKIKDFTYKTALISVLCASVSLCVFLGTGALLKEGLAYVPGLTSYISSSFEDATETNIESQETQNTTDKAEKPDETEKVDKVDKIDKIDLNRPKDPNVDNDSAFANRLDIWQACFKEFLEAPIFGVGRENVLEKASPNLKDDMWSYHLQYGNAHNIYLCVLVSSGIIGFLFIGSFAVITVSRTIKTVAKTYKKINIWLLAAFSLCLMLYAIEFVESRILYKIGIFGTVFWIYCGYMYKLSKIEKAENSEQLAPK